MTKRNEPIVPKDSTTQGSVTVAGHAINYQAVAGTILVAATNDADAAMGISPPPVKDPAEAPPTARMFYVAYFKKDVPPESRPVTFIYNGGPGSSTDVAAHGRLRSQACRNRRRPAHQPRPLSTWSTTPTVCSTPATWSSSMHPAPASAVSSARTRRKRSTAWILSAYAFTEFITQFLSKYHRWNSPKYLFGESYGTPRSAVVINGRLESESAPSISTG